MESERIEIEGKMRELFNVLQMEESADTAEYREAFERLLDEAFQPGNLKLFLRVLTDQPDEIRKRMYREILLTKRNAVGVLKALEKHFKWCFDRNRKHTRALLSPIAEDNRALPAAFRLTSLTRDATVARELMALIRKHDNEELKTAVLWALKSPDPRLQAFALHVARKMKDERMIPGLLSYYLKLEGDNKLRLQARRALLESLSPASAPLVLKWLRDESNAEIRLVGVGAALRLLDPGLVSDLVRLVLIDPRTRVPAATTLLNYETRGIVSFRPDDPRSLEAGTVLSRAKAKPLMKVLGELLSSENVVIREIALKFLYLVPGEKELIRTVKRLAERDSSAKVQITALRLLNDYGSQDAIDILVDILSDPAGAAKNSPLVHQARDLFDEIVPDERRQELLRLIAHRKEEREQALSRFEAQYESWREQL